MSKLGENIGAELVRQNIKAEDLARLINGLDPSTLRKLIYRNSSTSKFAPQIATVLKVNLEWLQTGEGNKHVNGVDVSALTNADLFFSGRKKYNDASSLQQQYSDKMLELSNEDLQEIAPIIDRYMKK